MEQVRELTVNKKDMSKFDFLFSTRFWAMIVGAFSVYLTAKGYIDEPLRNLIATLTVGFVSVRTFDRASEKLAGQ